MRFLDGTSRKVRFEPSYLTGVFQALKDQDLFEEDLADLSGNAAALASFNVLSEVFDGASGDGLKKE